MRSGKHVWLLKEGDDEIIQTTLYLDADVIQEISRDKKTGQYLIERYPKLVNTHIKTVQDGLISIKRFVVQILSGYTGITAIVILTVNPSIEYIISLTAANTLFVFKPKYLLKPLIWGVKQFTVSKF
ncbi:MAG: hypothetical protein N4A46_04860 [Schleiferiaceae bacterium]|nr:hypothetical protein [Schleiferiaceae bacterium]